MNGIRTACRPQLLHQLQPMAALTEMAVEEVAQAVDRLAVVVLERLATQCVAIQLQVVVWLVASALLAVVAQTVQVAVEQAVVASVELAVAQLAVVVAVTVGMAVAADMVAEVMAGKAAAEVDRLAVAGSRSSPWVAHRLEPSRAAGRNPWADRLAVQEVLRFFSPDGELCRR